MIIDLTNHTENHGTKMEAYFKAKEEMRTNRYHCLPTCMRDFIEQHTELYILIDKMLSKKKVLPNHIQLARNIRKQGKQVKIHSTKTSNTSEYFQKLIEKAEHSSERFAKELSQSIHSVQCNLLGKDDEKTLQSFKKCWMKFIDHEINELIEEAS